MSDEIAVGVPMYSRDEALRQFLESVPGYVETAYVADNGPDQDRQLYRESWPFELEVIHLEHDIGIGACRRALVDASDEPYLWMGDCDMRFLRDDDLRVLRRVLDANPDLGGAAGWLVEGDAVRSGARDLEVSSGTIIKTAAEPTVEHGPVPFARFDFIPQACLFRRETFETYTYDPAMASSEHVDFFYGQSLADEWDFASVPSVTIHHQRDIDEDYRESKRGSDHLNSSRLEQKWDLHDTAPGARSDWAQVQDQSVPEQAFGIFKRATPPGVWLPVKRGLEAVVR